MERIRINQREVGIIAPKRDCNKVTQLETRGLLTCFALGLYDPAAQVGLLSHIDAVGDFQLGLLVKNMSPLLHDLGVTNVTIETVNAWSNPLRVLYLSIVLSTLKRNGFQVTPFTRADKSVESWRDLGMSYAAVLDPQIGLKKLTYHEYEQSLNPEQSDTDMNPLKDLRRLFTDFSIRLVYKPKR
ncbi:MAG: hypothetical protein ABI758_00055 [Candidatus Woesebacteria bacterium]